MQNGPKEYARILPFRREKADGDKPSLGKRKGVVARQWHHLRQDVVQGWHRLSALTQSFGLLLRQREGLCLVLAAFFAAQATLFGELSPFGPAFFVLVALAYSRYAAPVFFSVLLGTAMVGWLETVLWLAGGSLTWFLLTHKPVSLRRFGPALTASLAFSGTCAVLLAFGVSVPWPWCVVYIALLHVSIHLLRPLTSVRTIRPGQTLASDQLIGAVLVGVFVFLGLAQIKVGLWRPQVSFSMAAILIMASQWGTGVTTVASLCVGALVSAALPASLPTGMGMLGLIGVGTSLGARHGRFGAAVGFLAANLLASMDIAELSDLQAWWLHAIVGLAVFLLTPDRWIERWTVFVPGTQAAAERETKAESRLRREINSRFTDLARVLSDLADTFESLPQETWVTVDYTAQLDALSEKACRGCPSFDKCWKDSFYVTYWHFLDLLTTAEKRGKVEFADLKEEVQDMCIRPAQLVMSVNYLLEMMRLNTYWRRRLHESQGIVSAQLQGAAQIFNSFVSAVHLTTDFVEEYEEKMTLSLRRAGIGRQVSVSQLPSGRTQVALTGYSCPGPALCEDQIADIVSGIMGEKYTLWHKRCPGKRTAATCRAVYLPEPTYELDVHSSAAAREGGWVCGDSFSRIPLTDGKMAFIVSDGMGSGSKAALESSTTVNLLKELLSCGFERKFAVKIVNSILMLRSPEDTFATVDLAIVDLYSGRVEFTKIGAAPSYIIRREGEVERIQSNTIPLGILQTVDYQSETALLNPYDTLVMVTDGIVDACKGSVWGDEWILQYLAASVRYDTSELAKALLDRAQRAAGGAKDDQMVVTITLWPSAQAVDHIVRSAADLPVIVRTTA